MNSKPKNLSQALDELEKLTDKTGQNFKEKLKSEIEDLESKLDELRPRLEELKSQAGEELKKTKSKVETQIKENPWMTLGIVGLIFFVIGLLFSRKND